MFEKAINPIYIYVHTYTQREYLYKCLVGVILNGIMVFIKAKGCQAKRPVPSVVCWSKVTHKSLKQYKLSVLHFADNQNLVVRLYY